MIPGCVPPRLVAVELVELVAAVVLVFWQFTDAVKEEYSSDQDGPRSPEPSWTSELLGLMLSQMKDNQFATVS